MIEANELRLNNLLQINGNYHKVAEIKTRSTRCYYTRKDTKLLHLSIIENQFLDPITLTEEILLKCGYLNTRNNHFVIKGHLIWFFNGLYMCDKNGITINYLHQLQNLYWCLCGKELEINLNN